MDGKQLKNSILQWAIQGKLVPQDPKDEPASVLLEKIRKEKERLVKEGKLKKKDLEVKPIEEDEKPFEIPEGWEWCRLEEVCFDIADIDHKMPPVSETGIPYISPLNFLPNNGIDYKGAKKVSYEDFERLSKKCKPQRGDIIFPRYGTIGIIRTIDTDIDFLVSYSCATLKPMQYGVLTSYITNVLQSPLIQFIEIPRYINKTTQPNVGLQSIKQFLFPLPPLAEQKRIVKKLEQILPLVEEYGKAQTQLDNLNKQLPEALKKSILQEAIQGKLVPQNPNDEPASALLAKIRQEKERLVKEGKLKKKDLEVKPIDEDEIPFEIPEGWAWARLDDVCSIVNGFTPSRTNETFWKNGTIPWFTVDDIHSQGRIIHYTAQHITQNALTENSPRILPPKSILLCCTASIGEFALSEISMTTNQQFNGLVIRDLYKQICSPYYLFSIAPTFKSFLLSQAGKTTFGFVSVKKLGSMLIPLPPLAEQKRIVAKIEELFKVL